MTSPRNSLMKSASAAGPSPPARASAMRARCSATERSSLAFAASRSAAAARSSAWTNCAESSATRHSKKTTFSRAARSTSAACARPGGSAGWSLPLCSAKGLPSERSRNSHRGRPNQRSVRDSILNGSVGQGPQNVHERAKRKKGGSRRVSDPAAPALTVSVAPATPTAVRTWWPPPPRPVVVRASAPSGALPEPPPPYPPCPAEGASGMPPAERGSQALRRLDLRCRRQSCEKSAAASGHVIPLTVKKNCAWRRTSGGGTPAPRPGLRGAREGTLAKTKSARRAGERLPFVRCQVELRGLGRSESRGGEQRQLAAQALAPFAQR